VQYASSLLVDPHTTDDPGTWSGGAMATRMQAFVSRPSAEDQSVIAALMLLWNDIGPFRICCAYDIFKVAAKRWIALLCTMIPGANQPALSTRSPSVIAVLTVCQPSRANTSLANDKLTWPAKRRANANPLWYASFGEVEIMKSLRGLTGVIAADDDSIVRGVLRSRLEAMHQEVFLAPDGLEAVDLGSQMRAALVMLDTDMPNLDGIAACPRIRQLRGYAGAPIVMLTVDDTQSAQTAALRSGATMFLVKPFPSARLMLTLSRFSPNENAALQEVRDHAGRASAGIVFENTNIRCPVW
jgi:CheY-like chemotaxis protein